MIALYPPCPVCARPLFPHRVPTKRPSLACVHCGALVHATEAAVAQSTACATLDELAPLAGLFHPPDGHLFVPGRLDPRHWHEAAATARAAWVPTVRREREKSTLRIGPLHGV